MRCDDASRHPASTPPHTSVRCTRHTALQPHRSAHDEPHFFGGTTTRARVPRRDRPLVQSVITNRGDQLLYHPHT